MSSSNTTIDATIRPTSTAANDKKPRQIFINLPVTDVAKSTEFYKAIGGTLNPLYSSPSCSCIVFSSTIHVMIMTPSMFAGFCPEGKEVVDAQKMCQVLICMSVEKREEVDGTCEIAHSKGGKKDPSVMKQMEGMYARSFEDLDGHTWELMWIDPEYRGDSCPVEKHRALEEAAKKRGEKLEAEKK